MGYHIGSLLHHGFTQKKASDYQEMMFHHLVTFYLYGFSYVTNLLIGPVVAFIHDLSDVFITWTRVWSETNIKWMTMHSFYVMICAWIYTRILVFPYVIYVSTVKLEVYGKSPYMQPIFGMLLGSLFLLHIYWLYFLIKILFNYYESG